MWHACWRLAHCYITVPGRRAPHVLQAPEILDGGRATAASDVFSFGLVLYEMLVWRLPWEGKTAFEVGPGCWRHMGFGVLCLLSLAKSALGSMWYPAAPAEMCPAPCSP